MLNRYENRALNDWSGTAIEINNEDGYILTPQVGAGKKDEDNRFTGIIMGQTKTKDKDQTGFKDQTGLFGYAAGARSIFLDADTGNAQFGLATKGQIKIDVDGPAAIRSGDYPEKEEDPKKGMQIQFSDPPHIKFGSGNFEVSPEGHIHAVGGGDIAGWQINDNSLSKGGVKISSDNKDDMNPEEIDNTKKAIEVIDENNKDIFSVDYRGYLHSEQGDIAGWTIAPNKLYKGDVGIAPQKVEVENIQHAFWASDKFYVNHDGTLHSEQGDIGGWTIAPNKLSYSTKNGNGDVLIEDKVGLSPTGNKLIWAKDGNNEQLFSVNNNGYLYAKNGEIGNWRFGENGLYSNKGTPYWDKNGTGVYVGADGIRLGNTFYVQPNGYVYALSGNIGDCDISRGGISKNGAKGTWSIGSDGTANFTNVNINGQSVIKLAGLTSSGTGTSLGNGATINPGNGGVKVPSGKTFDNHIQDDIINAKYISSKLNELESVYVQRLSCTGSMTAKDFNAETLTKDDADAATEDYVNALFNSLLRRIEALENKS